MLISLENINHFSAVSILKRHYSAISNFTLDEGLPTGVIVTWQTITKSLLGVFKELC